MKPYFYFSSTSSYRCRSSLSNKIGRTNLFFSITNIPTKTNFAKYNYRLINSDKEIKILRHLQDL